MNRSHFLSALAGAALLLAAGPSLAQDQPERRLDSPSAAASDTDFRTGLAGSGVMVDASTDKTDASLAFSWSDEYPTTEAFRTLSLAVKATTPLGSDKASADFITDRGLAGVGSLDLNFSVLTTDRVRSRVEGIRIAQIVASATEACVRAGGPEAVCESQDPHALWAYLSDAEKLDLAADTSDIWTSVWSFTAGVGAKTYKFRDPLSLAQNEMTQTPFSFAIQYGRAPQVGPSWTSGWYRGAGFEYSERYEEASAQTLCSPPPPTGPVECFTSPYSAPERQRRAAVFGVLRREGLSDALGLSWGVQLRAAYDLESEVAGLEGTLYVFPGGDALRGGIRIKLQTEDDDPLTDDETSSIGIFVGKPF